MPTGIYEHKPHSEETKRKIGLSNSISLKGHRPWNKGLTKKEYPQLSNSGVKKGKKMPPRTEEHRKKISQNMKERRKNIIVPVKDTKIETKIQNFLKKLRIEFFTHQYIKIKHGYQCDILIPSKKLVIECDGDYWHKYPVGRDIDHIRTSELIKKGFGVLRLWEIDIIPMELNDFQNKLMEVKK